MLNHNGQAPDCAMLKVTRQVDQQLLLAQHSGVHTPLSLSVPAHATEVIRPGPLEPRPVLLDVNTGDDLDFIVSGSHRYVPSKTFVLGFGPTTTGRSKPCSIHRIPLRKPWAYNILRD